MKEIKKASEVFIFVLIFSMCMNQIEAAQVPFQQWEISITKPAIYVALKAGDIVSGRILLNSTATYSLYWINEALINAAGTTVTGTVATHTRTNSGGFLNYTVAADGNYMFALVVSGSAVDLEVELRVFVNHFHVQTIFETVRSINSGVKFLSFRTPATCRGVFYYTGPTATITFISPITTQASPAYTMTPGQTSLAFQINRAGIWRIKIDHGMTNPNTNIKATAKLNTLDTQQCTNVCSGKTGVIGMDDPETYVCKCDKYKEGWFWDLNTKVCKQFCETGYTLMGPYDCVKCGDGIVGTGEKCDQGTDCQSDCTCPTTHIPKAPNACQLGTCADGFYTTNQICDAGAKCKSDCTCPSTDIPDKTGGCKTGTCGDGYITDGENCDSGTACPGLGQTGACTCPSTDIPDGSKGCKLGICGDGAFTTNEICDAGTDCQSDCTCKSTDVPDGSAGCKAGICGDGYITDGQNCDSGSNCPASGATGACTCPSTDVPDGSKGCKAGTCGDGYITDGENCDSGTACPNPSCTCAATDIPDGSKGCKTGTCGDGFITTGQNCDGGTACPGLGQTGACNCASTDVPDGSKGCKAGTCGDGYITDGENCDSGTDCPGFGVTGACTCPSTYIPDGSKGCKLGTCGDGSFTSNEICDAGTNCQSDCTCPSTDIPDTTGGCKAGTCGDGYITDGENCDSGTDCPGFGVIGACTCPSGYIPDASKGCSKLCGNSIVNPGQACDNVHDLGCTATCTIVKGYKCISKLGSPSRCYWACGDGVLDLTEECDAGARPGCSRECKVLPDYQCESDLGKISNCTLTSICGDGIRSLSEECDNGNREGCRNCFLERGYICYGNVKSSSSCFKLPVCGNGILESGEKCDNGGQRGCSRDCTIDPGYDCVNFLGKVSFCSLCGNSIVEYGQDCDNGNQLGCSKGCKVDPSYQCRGSSSQCSRANPICGNGVIEVAESCDDGNRDNGDGCNSFCFIEPQYTCEGEMTEKSHCYLKTETKTPVCGNGIYEPGLPTDRYFGINGVNGYNPTINSYGFNAYYGEECDNGNKTGCINCKLDPEWNCQNVANQPSSCTPKIVVAHCGNGVFESNLDEQCDDSNIDNGDGCTFFCRVEYNWICPNGVNCIRKENYVSPACGNGQLELSQLEECDDGNFNNNDGCNNRCRVENGWECPNKFQGYRSICISSLSAFCGNGIIEGNEQCDDGFPVMSGDGCNSQCRIQQGWQCYKYSPTQSTCFQI